MPLPSFELTSTSSHAISRKRVRCYASRTSPSTLTDLRLVVRQTADIMRRFGAIEGADYQRVQDVGRDEGLIDEVGRVVPRMLGGAADAPRTAAATGGTESRESLDQLFMLAMRPFLLVARRCCSRGRELATWTHAYCPLCGGEPDFSVITPAAERHLICGRCPLRWRFEA